MGNPLLPPVLPVILPLILAGALLAGPCPANAGSPAPVIVAHFSAGDLGAWEEKRFAGQTAYRFDGAMGGGMLHATARDAASGLSRDIRVDLLKTPIVTWHWALGRGRAGLDPLRRAGDDFPLRVYFVVRRGLFDLDSIAVQYVWSLSRPAGDSWPNPFAGSVMQLAVDSGPAPAGVPLARSRNLRADFRLLFGEEVDHVDTIAIMTDSDNAGGTSEGWYGDITFSAE